MIFGVIEVLVFFGLIPGALQGRDGEVEEPHGSQPVLQGSQEWHQEAQEAEAHFHQRGRQLCLRFFLFLI